MTGGGEKSRGCLEPGGQSIQSNQKPNGISLFILVLSTGRAEPAAVAAGGIVVAAVDAALDTHKDPKGDAMVVVMMLVHGNLPAWDRHRLGDDHRRLHSPLLSHQDTPNPFMDGF